MSGQTVISRPGATLSGAEPLLAHHVAALSTQAPFAVPQAVPGRRLVHLTSGGPAAQALPAHDLAQAFARVVARPDATALAYSDSRGLPRLREVLAATEAVPVDRVLVTNGALHGLHLVFTAVVDPGDIVVVEDPVFPDTPRVIEDAGGRAVGLPVDDEGLDVDALERLLREGTTTAGGRVKAVYVVPDYQNPSGHVLSAQRRRRLVQLAEEFDFLVVSDNPYRLQGLSDVLVEDFTNDSDHVVRVNTFSKTLGPGLRLGWVVAPAWLAPHLLNLRRRIDFQSASHTQQVVAELLEQPGWFTDVAARAREVYRSRAHTLVTSLRSAAGHVLEFTEPTGGFFVWARVVAPGVAPAALAGAAAQAGLVFPTGSPFAVTPSSAAHGFVRLAYSGADLEDLATAGHVIADAARRVQESAAELRDPDGVAVA